MSGRRSFSNGAESLHNDGGYGAAVWPSRCAPSILFPAGGEPPSTRGEPERASTLVEPAQFSVPAGLNRSPRKA